MTDDENGNGRSKVKFLEGTAFINMYLRDRAYGGPEEGGWWYETGELISSEQATLSNLDVVVEKYEKWCEEENKGRYPISSVLSTGRYCVRIEDEPGASYPTHRPHYE